MHIQRKFLLIIAIAGLLNIFLPELIVSGESDAATVTGFKILPWLLTAYFICAALIAFTGVQTEAIKNRCKIIFLLFEVAIIIPITIITINIFHDLPEIFAKQYLLTLCRAGLLLIFFIVIQLVLWIYKYRDTSIPAKAEFKKSISIPVKFKSNNDEPATTRTLVNYEKLSKLKEKGNISEEEFRRLKAKLIINNFLFGFPDPD